MKDDLSNLLESYFINEDIVTTWQWVQTKPFIVIRYSINVRNHITTSCSALAHPNPNVQFYLKVAILTLTLTLT